MNFFILTVKSNIFKSQKRFLKYIHQQKLLHVEIILPNSHQTFITEFNKIAKKLENKTENIRNTIVFVDTDLFSHNGETFLSSYKDLNPLNDNEFPQLIAMLILAFPEIHWVFMPGIFIDKPNDFHVYKINELNEFIKRVLSLNNSDLIALFDPCNLRNSIKQNIYKTEKGIPKRGLLAAAIDEEISYALMNAYTAYRFGYRAWVVSSFETMKHVFGKNSKIKKVDLVFEDLYLNFPDRGADDHLSELTVRDDDKNFPKLKGVDDRILITVGHKNTGGAKNTWRCNLEYLKSDFNDRYKILYKPLAGIFDLWKKAGKWQWIKNCPKLPDSFDWPLKKIIDDEDKSHSAPGRLLLISEKLLARSKRILKNADSVTDAIHSATLALEAKELLACKTPTMSLEALSLQHQAEVEAECMFCGVEYDLDVKSRIKDIKKEVTAISKWFHPSSKKRSQLNAEITIFSALAQRYRKYSQFDEENVLLHENRKLTNTLGVNRNPLLLLAWPFRAYVNFLLQSLTRFAFVILAWVFLFGVIYWYVARLTPQIEVYFIDSIIVSAKTFLAFQPPSLEYWVKKPPDMTFTPFRLFWFIGPAVLGFIHLGIFISHLTMILMRKPGG